MPARTFAIVAANLEAAMLGIEPAVESFGNGEAAGAQDEGAGRRDDSPHTVAGRSST